MERVKNCTHAQFVNMKYQDGQMYFLTDDKKLYICVGSTPIKINAIVGEKDETLDSPVLYGNSRAETPGTGDVSMRIATTQFVATILLEYAKKSYVDNAVSSATSGYITQSQLDSILSSYATQSWVEENFERKV
jgi:hypothetical protein